MNLILNFILFNIQSPSNWTDNDDFFEYFNQYSSRDSSSSLLSRVDYKNYIIMSREKFWLPLVTTLTKNWSFGINKREKKIKIN